jgi:ATP-binding cassette subfamily C (CFTR/MRP) protein 4
MTVTATNTSHFSTLAQVHFLKEADWIVVMDGGSVVRQGTWSDVMDIDISQYVSPEASDDDLDGQSEQKEMEFGNDEDIPYIDDVPEHSNGYTKLRRLESKKSLSRISSVASIDEATLIEQTDDRDEEKNSKKIHFVKVFYEYFRAGASPLVLIAIVIYLLFSQAVTSGSDLFLTFWTNQELLRSQGDATAFETTDGLYIYGFLILAVIFVTLSRGFIFFAVCMRSSKRLHDKSFLCLLHSPMRFFDLNPSGRILNRFSKDMGACDELLPRAIVDAAQVMMPTRVSDAKLTVIDFFDPQNLLVMLGVLILIGITSSGYAFFVALIAAIILYGLILRLYLRPAKDLKRLEGISKHTYIATTRCD